MTAAEPVVRPDSAWGTARLVPRLTYRQFDHWCLKGYIHVSNEDGTPSTEGKTGHGFPRTIADAEVLVLTLMSALVDAGLQPAVAVRVARQLAQGDVGRLGRFQILKAS